MTSSPLEAAVVDGSAASVGDEYRSHMIMPLALGGDSGRHMGATGRVRTLSSAPERPVENIVATFREADSLPALLGRAGLSSRDVADVTALLAPAMDERALSPGTAFSVTLGERPEGAAHRPLQSLEFRAALDLALAIERDGERLVLRRQPIAVDSTPLRVRGRVGASLYRSARAAGAPPEAVQEYLKALKAHIDIAALGANDTFDLIVAHRRAATGEREAGKLLYAGLQRDSGGAVELMRWGPHGAFYNPRGLGEERGGYVQPVVGRVSSHFGYRVHPILRYKRMHGGIDFAAPTGTPIRAVSEGRVTGAGRMGGCGIAVVLDHPGALSSRYCHMSRMAVRHGERVTRGQIIGYVGSTGMSTGPHLHFEIYRGGQLINPQQVRFTTRDAISPAELARFRSQLQQLTATPVGAALKPLPSAPAAREGEPLREIDRLVEQRKTV
ncbi:M23 family metallopeptidase [Qipengyuania thermophila]|uniref:M23 family metallopeptidase n=1 Tax=Qipengyuania thermophila TaxID=2509361 RepID=UPI0013EB49C6|nr:M23 family metallopeptidase [Qipengyuania thermophila]